MLETNASLGWRDVQEILANAAINTGGESGWQTNGAGTLNGGGYTVSHDFGFGLIDAKAAVRLAESWKGQNDGSSEITFAQDIEITAANQTVADLSSNSYTVTISDDAAPDMRIEWVEVTIAIEHDNPGDLRIVLNGPSGISSVLAGRPMGGQYAVNDLNFTFSSAFHRGEALQGDWTVQVFDDAIDSTGTITSASLRFYGGAATDDSTYIVTDAFADSGSDPAVITDTGGADFLNLAAYSEAVTLNLRPGAEVLLNGSALQFGENTWIENATGGDGGDRIVANGLNNRLEGARGNDQLIGGGGDDELQGGDGTDILSGGGGDDLLVGGAGADQLLMGSGADQAYGGDGTDIIRVRADQLDRFDTIDGGNGAFDTLILQSTGLLERIERQLNH